MSELERANKRLRAVVEELKKSVESMRDLMISTVLDDTAQIEQENAELRKKAEAWELLADMHVDFWFEQVRGGWKCATRANEATGATPFEAVMIAFGRYDDEDDHEMR